MVMVPVDPMTAGMVAAARHRGAAFGAELSPLRHHARRDLGLVGNELIAQPHRVGRAGLAYVDGLRVGAAETARESQREN
jgi:hypothetical protein